MAHLPSLRTGVDGKAPNEARVVAMGAACDGPAACAPLSSFGDLLRSALFLSVMPFGPGEAAAGVASRACHT